MPIPASATAGAGEPCSLPADMFPAVEAFCDYLHGECGLARNTCQAYRRDLANFGAFLYETRCRSLGEITPAIVEKFLQSQSAAGKSPASVSRALAAIRTFCRFCVLERILSVDPSDSVIPPRKWSRLPGTLSHEAVMDLLETPSCEEDKHWLRDRTALTLLYVTGMRAGELVGVKIGDVNFDLGVIRVFGKGGKERIVPVASVALELASRYVRQARARSGDRSVDQRLLLSRTGRPLRREDVFRMVRKYVRRAAFRRQVSPHTLRHCFATHLLAGGADLRSVQEMLGHADVSTTQIYTHVDASRLKAIHKKFHPRG